ncbi:MAG: hypothetical protein JXA44_06980 [Methanospirillaceae archaeon]|nr:hypothetical protein [Methanospirillaceae archaeon]
MQEPRGYEEYPIQIVIASNLISLLIYVIGVYILSLYSPFPAILYLCFIGILEFRLICRHCTDCYYFGKVCAFGKSRLSSLLCKPGHPERFSQKKCSGADIVPDLLVFLIPLLAGLLYLAINLSWIIVLLVLTLFILGFLGNALVRGNVACRHCRQREIGCPAEQLFDTSKKS